MSIDGSLTGFDPRMDLHYKIAGAYSPEVHLIGSNTITTGIKLYGDGIPPENPRDFEKPERDSNLPHWVVIDSRGKFEGMLHICRRFEFCRDVFVHLSDQTPETYLDYLKERQYDFYVTGPDHVNLQKALQLLLDIYKTRTIVTDAGRILGNLLLNQGLVDEVSLLVHPLIIENTGYTMFGNVNRSISLELIKKNLLENHYLWLVYRMIYD